MLPQLDPWNPAVHEAPAPPAIPTMDYEAEIDTPEPPTGALLVRYPDATYEVRATYALPAGASEAEATFRLYTGGLPSSWHSMVEFSNPVYAYGAGGGPGQTIDVRMRVFDVDGNGSYFSDVFSTALAIDDTAPASAPNADVTVTAEAASPPTSALFDNVAPTRSTSPMPGSRAAIGRAAAAAGRRPLPSKRTYGPASPTGCSMQASRRSMSATAGSGA